MRTCFLLLMCYCCTCLAGFAQKKNGTVVEKSNFIIGLHYDYIFTDKLFFKNSYSVNGSGSGIDASPQFSLSVSGKLYKFLYLKTAFGTNYTTNITKLEVRSFSSTTGSATIHQITPRYINNYLYLSLLPEIRVSDPTQTVSVFINSGLTTYCCNYNKFYRDSYFYTANFLTAEQMAEGFNGPGRAWESNIGIDVKHKRVAINTGFGYTLMSTRKRSVYDKDSPYIVLHQFKMMLGFSYYL